MLYFFFCSLFLFFSACSFYFAGVKPGRKPVILIFVLPVTGLFCYWLISYFISPKMAVILSPFMIFFTLMMVLIFALKRPVSVAINSFFCTYLYIQVPILISNIFEFFTKSTAIGTIAEFFAFILAFFIMYFTFGKKIIIFINNTMTKSLVFTVIPLVFFIYDYTLQVKPEFLETGSIIAASILPAIISVFFFYFIFIYTREITKEKDQLVTLTREAIFALSYAGEINDFYTNGHSMRVADYSSQIARRMGLSEFEITEIYYAGLLHDVGKIGIDNNIINKNGRLTDVEYQVMKNHPKMGFKMLDGMSQKTEFKNLASGALSHHEHYDGSGYPSGIKGDEIPLSARIIAIADAYDAMTSYRSYRDALPQAEVRAEIEKGLGTQFDKEIGKIMLQMIDEDKNYEMCEPKVFDFEETLEEVEEA